MKASRNISLMIGLAVPVLMVVFVAASIYLPALWAPEPATNFLYASGDHYYGRSRYAVVGDTLTKLDVKEPEHLPTPTPVVRFFVYDVTAKTSTEVSFEQAQQLSLDSRDKSPDGYTVRYGNHDGGVFPFFYSGGRNGETLYLTGHHGSRKLQLEAPGDSLNYYYSRVRFIGWIRPGGSHGEK